MKKIMTLMIAMMLIVSSVVTYGGEAIDDFYIEYDGTTYQYTSPTMTIKINGTEIETGEMPAVVINGTTMVPAREVFESLAIGGVVGWNNDTQEVSIVFEDKFVVLKIDSEIAYVNGAPVAILDNQGNQATPKLIKPTVGGTQYQYAKTMIPLRFVTENFGFIVKWSADDPWVVNVNDEDYVEVPDAEEPGDTDQPVTEPEDNTDPGTEEPDDQEPDTDEPDDTPDNTGGTDVGEVYVPDTSIGDYTGVSGQKLDRFTGEKAKLSLPTALFSQPIKLLPEVETTDTGEVIVDEPIGEEYVFDDSAQDHDTVPFTDFVFHNTDDSAYFEILAEGPISKIKSMSYWAGKLIIMIENASFGYDTTSGTYTHEFEDNPYFTKVSSAQQENDANGNKILSVIFELVDEEDDDFHVRISEDRESLYIGKMEEMVSVEVENTLDAITIHQDDKGDYVDIHFGVEPKINLFRLSSTDRIVLDLRNTVTKLDTRSLTDVGGQYITAFRTAQFGIDDPENDDQNEFISRIVLEMDGQASYEMTKLDDHTIRIQLTEPDFENITYENVDVPTITLEDIDGTFELDGITYEDNYRNHEYIITIPGSHSANFGSGIVNISDEIIESINITEYEGNTIVTIKERTIHVFTLDDSNDQLSIRAYKPKEVYDQIIIIDAGHGGKDPGATVPNPSNGLYEESDINLEMMFALKRLLDADGSIKVYYSRMNDDYVTLQERVTLANQVEADLFISIHNNAYVSTIKGMETLYFKDAPMPGLNAYEMADIIHNIMIDATGQVDRKAKQNNTLYVLRKTAMPAILLEGGFMTNSEDLVKIIDPNYQKLFAKSLYEGIMEVLNQYPIGRNVDNALPIVAEKIPAGLTVNMHLDNDPVEESDTGETDSTDSGNESGETDTDTGTPIENETDETTAPSENEGTTGGSGGTDVPQADTSKISFNFADIKIKDTVIAGKTYLELNDILGEPLAIEYLDISIPDAYDKARFALVTYEGVEVEFDLGFEPYIKDLQDAVAFRFDITGPGESVAGIQVGMTLEQLGAYDVTVRSLSHIDENDAEGYLIEKLLTSFKVEGRYAGKTEGFILYGAFTTSEKDQYPSGHIEPMAVVFVVESGVVTRLILGYPEIG